MSVQQVITDPDNITFTLSSTDTWKEFEPKQKKDVGLTQKKWVWTNSIVLKSKDALKLKMLILQWVGEKIDHLSASLYYKRDKEECVLPIEKNLVCDGCWNKKKQQIVFHVNEKIVAVNTYSLVLSFAHTIEDIIKSGTFVISKQFDTQKNINES